MSQNSCLTNICEYFAPNNANGLRNGSQSDDQSVTDWSHSCNSWLNYRNTLFTKLSQKLDHRIHEVRRDSYSKLMDSLFDLIHKNCNNYKTQQNHFTSKLTSNNGLIPTARLYLGMSSVEHKLICDLLVETLQDLTSTVVYLNSNDCQNIGSAFKRISDSVLNEEMMASIDFDENQMKRCSFSTLFNIYEEQIINENTNNFCPPIVLFFDEIESLDHSVMSRLIMIIKEYTDRIPFILLLSCSNNSTSLQSLLPAMATDCLLIEEFRSIPETEILDQLIDDILCDSQIELKLGPNVLNFAIKVFKLFDFSIQNFQNLIKYIIFEHYYSNPLSIVCQPIKKLKKFCKKLNSNELELLRSSLLVESLQSSMNDMNGSDFKKSFIKNVEELQLSYNRFLSHLRIIVKLVNQSCGEGICLHNLYISALNPSFDFKEVINSLNKVSQNQWKLSLESCLSDNSLNDETLPLIIALKSCHKELCELIITFQSEPKVVLERVDISSFKNKLSNLKTRSQWKETINPVNAPKVFTKFEVWKKTTINVIEDVLNDSTKLNSHPLHSAIFFDDLNLLKRHNFVIIRNDIQKDLSDPSIKSLATNNERPTVPDFVALFSLYQESDSIINMYDWFTAFKSDDNPLVESTKSVKRKKTQNATNQVNDETTIVRFLNTISDFEYIGLIQPEKRKTDHLMRLVWF